MTDESIPKKGPASTPVDEGDDANDRPTVSPPFDVEAFARAATSNLPDVLTIRPPPSLTLPHAMPSTSPPKVPSSEPQRSTSALWMADSLAPSAPPPRDATRRERPSIGSESALLQAMGATPAPEITERTIDDPCGEMRERASLGDFTGAIEMAELILADVPENAEDYVHRIGRTGRALHTGDAFTLVTEDDVRDARSIERFIGASIERKKIDGFPYVYSALFDQKVLDEAVPKASSSRLHRGSRR